MRGTIMTAAATLFLGLSGAPAMAAEEDFLPSLAGRWSGGGTVTTRIGTPPVRVSCNFTSTANASALSLSGQCRGLLVVRRQVSADLNRQGGRYAGTYIGPSGRPAALSGGRKGDTLDFAVRWSREINGDRDARMTIRKTGAKGLVLRTLDRDPKTGRTVTTSEIRLTR
ncbi:hypothetical protein BJF93_14150 [Xaviernesmea oryzae]|uniref:Uncharacterized protein n=1 Tax=Xaviernesmea oryzae TaxID=464029 RepID=A0A1Q9ARG1_9HYPH|nr:hypothetical protein [Xaviernesmea oryzae]OLP57969.1 hypothetical protein BJF93_14150 [Xaviernesmea oryzae]SEL28567.1 hypothetical protein SAMN04487976_10733 [Xaviernesmea oryzae]